MASKDFLFRILGDASQGIGELDKFAKKADDLTHLGQAGMVAGGLLAAGVALAVHEYAEFDAAMSGVIATGEDAAANQDALRQAALDAGASTVFSATESANAIEELAKAGISAKDTLAGGLDGALNLAAAGGLDVADAASTMATAMTQFSVEGKDATHVADLLAAGAGKAQGDVSDMSFALAQAGLVANATGLSIEETTGGLAAFASAGLLGSDAGTSFKSMLQRLTPQSDAAAAMMSELGINAYDAQGNFIGLANFAGNLQGALHDLTPEQRQSALATIFGSDAVRAATILYNQGAAGIRKWTDDVNDQGYAADVARTRLNNLQGDLEGLGGAIDTALIKQGSGANDTLRALTSTAAGAVGWFSELPDPLQQTGLYLTIAAAGVGLFGGGAIVAVPKVLAFKQSIEASKFSLGGLSLAAAGATVGLAAVIAVVAAVAAEQAQAQARAEAYIDTLEDGTHRVTKATRDMAKENLAASRSFLWMDQGSAYDNAKALGIGLDLVTDAAMGEADAIDELQKQLEHAKSHHDDLGLSAQSAQLFSDRLADSVKGEASSLSKAGEMARQKEQADRDVAKSTTQAAGSADSAAKAYLNEADQIAKATEEVDKLLESIDAANGRGTDAVSTNARWQKSLADIGREAKAQSDAYLEANGSLDGFTLSLDESTESGSANAAMLAGAAADARDAAKAQYEVEKNTLGAKTATENYASTLASQRQAFEDAARNAGFNADEVHRLSEEVFGLPTEKQLTVVANTSEATKGIETLASVWNGIRDRTVNLTFQYPNGQPISDAQLADQAGNALGISFQAYAGGGEVRGPGTRTSDSILAWLSDREFVVNADDAQKNKGLLEYINAGGDMDAFAGGGMVGLAAANSTSTVRMQPLVGSDVAATSSRGERQQELREVVAAVVETLPRGNSYTYQWPEGATAEQLLRAQEEDQSMHLRLG